MLTATPIMNLKSEALQEILQFRDETSRNAITRTTGFRRDSTYRNVLDV